MSKKSEPQILHNFSGYKHAGKLANILFERRDSNCTLEYNNFSVQYQEYILISKENTAGDNISKANNKNIGNVKYIENGGRSIDDTI